MSVRTSQALVFLPKFPCSGECSQDSRGGRPHRQHSELPARKCILPLTPQRKREKKTKKSTTLYAPLQNKTKPEKQLQNSPCILLFIYYLRIIYIIKNYIDYICIVYYTYNICIYYTYLYYMVVQCHIASSFCVASLP